MMEESEKVLLKQAMDFNYYYVKQIAAKQLFLLSRQLFVK